LLRNTLAGNSDLIVFSDAARVVAKQSAVVEVRDYLKTITGFRSVTIHHRPCNFGLAKSIIDGVTEVLKQHDRIIVLEDDMLTSPHFLSFMNEALDLFAEDDRVVSVHGYIYPIKQSLPEAFFLPGADCWGWATWRRAWALFNPNGQYLLDQLKKRKLLNAFDFHGAYHYSRMLKGQIKGTNDSWAVLWYASAFLAGKLTLYPGRSLVRNIGNDNSGTHSSESKIYDSALSTTPINLSHLEVQPSTNGRQAFEDFLKQAREGWVRKTLRRARSLAGRFAQ